MACNGQEFKFIKECTVTSYESLAEKLYVGIQSTMVLDGKSISAYRTWLSFGKLTRMRMLHWTIIRVIASPAHECDRQERRSV